MSENDDTFAGTSARSTKHSAREDDALAHEIEGMIRSGRSTHAEEWNDPEPVAEGDPVTWKSHGGEAEGTVDRKITSDTEAAGRTVRASKENPQYEVTSEKSGGTAVHKPEALHKD